MKFGFLIKMMIVIFAVTSFPAGTCQAAGPTKAGVSPAVSKELASLLALLDSGREAGFDSTRIPALMAFVHAPKP